MKKLLITGFEQFGGEKINPSWEAVKLLPEAIGEFELHKIEVQVVFEKAAEFVLKTAAEICVKVNGKSLKMCWGIGGTNYCKNMEYIGSTLSRLDAHAGLYNGRIIDSTVNYISLTG